jgi:LEA14-like dessication related protein
MEESMNRPHRLPATPLKALILLILMVVSVLLLAGCGSLRDVVETIRKPEVRIDAIELEALSFSGLTLRFDMEISNPNPIGISLSGFDYELQIEGTPFVTGEVDEKVTVAARDRFIVPLPVELGFEELVRTIRELEDREEAAYQLTSGFSFDLPVLGRMRIPVSTEGSVPILRFPGLQVRSLRLNKISLAGASLDLELEMRNRNNFKIFLESLEYRFQVDGRDWASGMRQERVRLGENDTAVMLIPIELDFAAVGRSVYQMILSGETLQYTLEADVDVGTSLRVLKKASLPFEVAGQLRVRR